ncbi:MAG TPA: PKD domain-containing protein [Thermoanaerobaculia bacterium]|nr:PKD domain-containing protein [Thermoanaerobaculia bacterium]
MPRLRIPFAALGLLFLALPACEEGTPVSPPGAILRMSAYPTRIAKAGVSTITIQALRSNGIPVNPGTEIRLSSTIGQIEPVVYTDGDGVATGHLRGDGRAGTATVRAFSGNVEPVEIEVAVGSLATSITLSATPTAIPEIGGEVDLLALVRDEVGQPLEDATVNFLTEAGTLESGGGFISTDAQGQAMDHLTVTAGDLQTITGDRFTVTVESGGAGGVVTASVEIGILRAPEASFTFQRVDNQVAFTDTSTGNPTIWRWDFGDGNTSTSRNPTHVYSASGSYLVTLTVRNSVGEDSASAVVNIP